jgi:hypothetical protein
MSIGARSISRTGVSLSETRVSRPGGALPSVSAMFSTLLTKRRAVDHCRVRSSLCRMS